MRDSGETRQELGEKGGYKRILAASVMAFPFMWGSGLGSGLMLPGGVLGLIDGERRD